MDEPKKCTICNTELLGEYCHKCGQQCTGEKVKFKTLIGDMLSSLFSLEKSGLGTIYQLVKNPYKVIGNYWAGNRNYYQGPGKMILYALLVLGLHITFVNNTVFGVSIESGEITSGTLFLTVSIPLFSMVTYLYYLRHRKNFLENLIAIIYFATCYSIIIIVITDILELITGAKLSAYGTFAYVFLVFLGAAQTFSHKRRWPNILLNAVLSLLILAAVVFGIASAFVFAGLGKVNYS